MADQFQNFDISDFIDLPLDMDTADMQHSAVDSAALSPPSTFLTRGIEREPSLPPLLDLPQMTDAGSPESMASLASPVFPENPLQNAFSSGAPASNLFPIPENSKNSILPAQALPAPSEIPPTSPEFLASLYAMAQNQIATGVPPFFLGAFPTGFPPFNPSALPSLNHPFFGKPIAAHEPMFPMDFGMYQASSDDEDEAPSRKPISGSKVQYETKLTEAEMQALDKTANSKERRQIRNKISARNFRLRRKEYITSLEGELASIKDENARLKAQLMFAHNENFMLRSELNVSKEKMVGGISPSAVDLGLNTFSNPAVPPIPAVPIVPPMSTDILPMKLENLLYMPPPKLTGGKYETAGPSRSNHIRVHAMQFDFPRMDGGKVKDLKGLEWHGQSDSDVASQLSRTVREVIP